MAQNQYNSLEYEAPVFSLIIIEDFIVITCGGGGKSFGMKNKIASFKYSFPFQQLNQKVSEIDTEDQLIESLTSNPQRTLILGSSDQNCIVFSLSPEGILAQIYLFQTDFKIKDPYQNIVKFNPLGNQIATGGDDGIIRLWKISFQNNVFSATKLNEIIAHSADIVNIDFHPKEDLLASVANDKTCRIFELKNFQEFKQLSMTEESVKENLKFVHCLFTTNGDYLYTIQNPDRGSSYLTKWDVYNDFSPVLTMKISNYPICSAKKNSELLALGSCEGMAIVFNLKQQKITQSKIMHDMILKTLDFTKDSKYLLTGSADSTYNILKIKNTSMILQQIIKFIVLFGVLLLLIAINKFI